MKIKFISIYSISLRRNNFLLAYACILYGKKLRVRAVKLSTKYNAEIEDRKIFCDKTLCSCNKNIHISTGCVRTCSLL